MATKKISLNELRNLVKMIIKEEIASTSKLYKKYGKRYPYASDAVAYYIFGDKSDYNILRKAFKGVRGRGSEIDAVEVSRYMWITNIRGKNEWKILMTLLKILKQGTVVY